MLASTVDFPMQSRGIEVVDEDNGYLSIYLTNFGHNSPEGSLAHYGRELAGAKRAFTALFTGAVDDFWAEDEVAQNLLLRIKISERLRASLAEHDWPMRIESEETLRYFRGP